MAKYCSHIDKENHDFNMTGFVFVAQRMQGNKKSDGFHRQRL